MYVDCAPWLQILDRISGRVLVHLLENIVCNIGHNDIQLGIVSRVGILVVHIDHCSMTVVLSVCLCLAIARSDLDCLEVW